MLFALTIVQDPAVATQPATAPPTIEQMLGTAPAIDTPYRLALTPKLDGKIEPEEWQSFGPNAYLQWEPNVLYWAAEAGKGQDVVLSLDWNGDGWLVGDDNLEIRASFKDGNPVVRLRRLDGTNPNGPAWVDANVLPESMNLVAQPTANGWTLEGRFAPIYGDGPTLGKRIAARIDLVSEGTDLAAAYIPRVLGKADLQMDAGQNLPTGLAWHTTWQVRSIPTNTTFKVRYDLTRSDDLNLKNVEFRAEGLAKDDLASGTQPFAEFDKKNRVGVSYETLIGPQATTGYRILRAKVLDSRGNETTLRSSFRVSDLVDFDVNLPTDLRPKDDAQIVRGSVYLRSQSMGKVEGNFDLIAPKDWTILKGAGVKVLVYHSRSSQRVPLEMITPRGAKGVFPITLRAEVNGKVMEHKVYLPIR